MVGNADKYEQSKGGNGKTLGIDPHTNLLRAPKDQFVLENKGPEHYEHIFPFSSPPQIEFNMRHVPMNTPEYLWMTDTTFRDGQQSLPPYTVDQIVRIYQFLHHIGGPNGMIKQSEFFLYSDKDKEAVRKCQELGLQYPEITGWVRATKKDFELVKWMGLKETGILTSVSDYHIFDKLKKSRREAIDMYLGIVKDALEVGILPRCHFEDITKADFYGFVVPFAQELMRLSEEANVPIKVRMCDTLGVAVPYPGAALPSSVPGLVYGLNCYAGFPSERLEWHGHNDFGNAKINAVTAWLYGCSVVNGTIFGFGERTGNTALEQTAVEFWRLKGTNNGMKLEALCELADYYEKEVGVSISPTFPFAGKAAFQTSAGIHIDGLLKGQAAGNMGVIYLPMNPDIVGNKASVIINDKSGAAGIAFKVNELMGLSNDKIVGKDNSSVIAISNWVDEQYKSGRVANISDHEIREQIRMHMKELTNT